MLQYPNSNNPKFPPPDDLIRVIRSKTLELVDLARDVFLSPYDLYLIDRATGALGGFCQGDDQADAPEDGSGDWSEAENYIRETFFVLSRPVPQIWTPSGYHYFIPALSMDSAAIAGFQSLALHAKAHACALIKAVLVDGHPLPGCSRSRGLRSLDWHCVFDYSSEMTLADEIDDEALILDEMIGDAMWFDRCLDRSGRKRLIGLLRESPQKLRGIVRKFSASSESAYNYLCLEGGLYGLHPMNSEDGNGVR